MFAIVTRLELMPATDGLSELHVDLFVDGIELFLADNTRQTTSVPSFSQRADDVLGQLDRLGATLAERLGGMGSAARRTIELHVIVLSHIEVALALNALETSTVPFTTEGGHKSSTSSSRRLGNNSSSTSSNGLEDTLGIGTADFSLRDHPFMASTVRRRLDDCKVLVLLGKEFLAVTTTEAIRMPSKLTAFDEIAISESPETSCTTSEEFLVITSLAGGSSVFDHDVASCVAELTSTVVAAETVPVHETPEEIDVVFVDADDLLAANTRSDTSVFDRVEGHRW